MTDKPTTPPAGEPTAEALKLAELLTQNLDYPNHRVNGRNCGWPSEGCRDCVATEIKLAAVEIDAHTAPLRAALSEAQSKLAEAEKEKDMWHRQYTQTSLALRDIEESLRTDLTAAEAKLAEAVKRAESAERAIEAALDSKSATKVLKHRVEELKNRAEAAEAKLAATEAQRDKAREAIRKALDIHYKANWGNWDSSDGFMIDTLKSGLSTPPVVPE